MYRFSFGRRVIIFAKHILFLSLSIPASLFLFPRAAIIYVVRIVGVKGQGFRGCPQRLAADDAFTQRESILGEETGSRPKIPDSFANEIRFQFRRNASQLNPFRE